MSKHILSVSEINSYIKTLMDHDLVLYGVLIRGEISNFKLHYSGHIYLTLKDEYSLIRAVMFKSANCRLKFKPENGMKVIAEGRITVYERDGQYQLYIEDMQPDGVGALHIAFEQLKAKLQREGLFDKERKKPLPLYPQKIGVVTSPTGAAIRDILNILKRRFPCAQVFIYPVLVQGEQACYQIVEGINYFNQSKTVDVIIIGRGGGSIEELWAFNEEIVARSIVMSAIPIVSAVGHETDFTISDFVSDLRAPTPSAAAEIVVPSRYELKDKINNLQTRLFYSFNKGIESKRLKLKNLIQSPSFRNPLDKIYENRLLLDTVSKNLIKNIQLKTKIRRELLKSICGKLDALSPLAVLSRGYAIAKGKDNKILRSVDSVTPGENIELQLSDGSIYCKVESLVKEE
ncbi:MAG: exodeoxyribonuclease large subunit [Petroclostridium sp.]|jgi:exodeoxyribonuclease VII large subunit|uniref:exodeoxyribonuclease VII large subunit n=1 Tax=Petroclostridium xylanilyticum TaxID=1792311 RepID=UPI000B996EDA|nr:exodeoxyribonuclease VII large subunit [Petroclostridium xylanilyticum]MBZ4644743.1 exodeoxyribonuclease large subunit [Clostridia bacterium]MDK2810346.1 exodeoxyribonuclease large subunit [Petroclostridium sp.]